MIDINTRAARAFYAEVRKFAVRHKPGMEALFYRTQAGYERYDFTLISRMVYGRPDEFLAVMASAGQDTTDDVMTERTLVLPTESQLTQIKMYTGYESRAEFREPGGVPMWFSDRMRAI